MRALFNAAKFGFLEKSWGKALGWLLTGYWLPLTGMLFGVVASVITLSVGNRLAALLLLLIGIVAGILFLPVAICRTIVVNLKTLDFGFCPGRTQVDNVDPGLSDWLAAVQSPTS